MSLLSMSPRNQCRSRILAPLKRNRIECNGSFASSDRLFSNNSIRCSLTPNEATFPDRSFRERLVHMANRLFVRDNTVLPAFESRRYMTTNANNSNQRRRHRASKSKKKSSLPVTTKDWIRNPSVHRGRTPSSEIAIFGNKPSSTTGELLSERLETRLNWARQGLENILGVKLGPNASKLSASDGPNATGNNSIAARAQQRKGAAMDFNWWFWNILFAACPAALIALVCEFYIKPIALAEQERRLALEDKINEDASSPRSNPHQHPRRSDPYSLKNQQRLESKTLAQKGQGRDGIDETASSQTWYEQQKQLLRFLVSKYILGSLEEDDMQSNGMVMPSSNHGSSSDDVNDKAMSAGSTQQSPSVATIEGNLAASESSENRSSKPLPHTVKNIQQAQLEELKDLRQRLQALEQELQNQQRQSVNSANTVPLTTSTEVESTRQVRLLPSKEDQEGVAKTQLGATTKTTTRLDRIRNWLFGSDNGGNDDKDEVETEKTPSQSQFSAPSSDAATKSSVFDRQAESDGIKSTAANAGVGESQQTELPDKKSNHSLWQSISSWPRSGPSNNSSNQ